MSAPLRRWTTRLWIVATAALLPGCGGSDNGSVTTEIDRREPVFISASDMTLLDNARRRRIPIRLYAPVVDPAEFRERALPLVLLSPRLGGSHEGYAYLAKHLSAQGYVCAVLTHPGTGHRAARRLEYAQLERTAATSHRLIERAKDLSFVIDRLTSEDFRHTMQLDLDPSRIAALGHGLGAHTAMAAAGATFRDAQGRQVSLRDRCVSAVVALSPPAAGRYGLTEDSWKDVPVPALLAAGQQELPDAEDDADGAAVPDAFAGLPQGGKYLLTLAKAGRFAFSTNAYNPETGEAVPRDSMHHVWVSQVVTAFLEAYLRGNAEATGWLAEKRIETASGGAARLRIK
ncbi:MAG: alpha/beta hydrolase family protein [Phycisphaerae bacterium]